MFLHKCNKTIRPSNISSHSNSHNFKVVNSKKNRRPKKRSKNLENHSNEKIPTPNTGAQIIPSPKEKTNSENRNIRILISRTESYNQALNRKNDYELDTFLSPQPIQREESSVPTKSILSITSSDNPFYPEKKRSEKHVDFI